MVFSEVLNGGLSEYRFSNANFRAQESQAIGFSCEGIVGAS